METSMNGSIFTGKLDTESNGFVLTQVKDMNTQTVLTNTQIDAIYDYLAKAVHYDEYHIITLYDQLPVRLRTDEITVLLGELDRIKEMIKYQELDH
ncbi:hypothetical protein PY093_15010 [Cytobacillus sp. S13-E01]|uniref:hypothetical protein n=1 Tax=Cytobacillus sp. S13-E01 TaxID=3031326 RepID=UPI0023D84D73|nr:hypothetical protein [Cytobacillus sp. S13-E01]MDF0727981.1 hypothetical protein [Cytobacillus sp. S13-E01]